MKKTSFCILLVLLIISCSKSGTDAAPEMSGMTGTMEEPGMNEEPKMNNEELLIGEFQDGAHPTNGTARVNEERTELELIEFKSDPGPILELYLATDVTATEYVSLGVLQGLEGDFTYILPADVDFETHKYVLVWCVDFSVSFGHAILEAPEM